MKRFIVKEVRVIGPSKEPAVVRFTKGLNVVSGASDTGKSYIYECLYYMLGGSTPPKSIPESTGYNEIRILLEFSDGQAVEISRDMNGGKYTIAGVAPTKYKNTLNNSAYTEFILDALGIKNVKLKKNQDNVTEKLSLSHLKYFFMVDETRIVSKQTPITSEQFTHKTVYESCFAFLLSGVDDSTLSRKPEKKVEDAKHTASLALIEELIMSLKSKLGEFNSREKVESEIDKFQKKIEKEIYRIEELNEQARNLNLVKEDNEESIRSLDHRIRGLNELASRFTILSESYGNDLRRLEFSEEGSYLFAQLNSSNCTFCGHEFTFTGDLHGSEVYQIQVAVAKEAEKIRYLNSDLNIALSQVTEDRETLVSKKAHLVGSVEEADFAIKSLRENQQIPVAENLKELILKREEFVEKQILLDEFQKYNAIKSRVENLKENSPKKQKKGTSKLDSYISDFNLILKKVLKDWTFSEDPKIEFNNKDLELIVDGKERRSYGKGFRAVIYAGFCAALLEKSLSSDLPHPGLIILDSPLTTHKEADIIDSDGEDVEIGIQEKFFHDLSSRFMSNQVIVFENKTPPSGIEDKINHIHFSKVPNDTSYGFFPSN